MQVQIGMKYSKNTNLGGSILELGMDAMTKLSLDTQIPVGSLTLDTKKLSIRAAAKIHFVIISH